MVGPQKANASIGAFIDDVIRIVTPPNRDDRALAASMNFDSISLTEALDARQYAQNAEKANISIYGRRTVAYRIANASTVIGSIMPHLLHLG